jgi:hypothetical protein
MESKTFARTSARRYRIVKKNIDELMHSETLEIGNAIVLIAAFMANSTPKTALF